MKKMRKKFFSSNELSAWSASKNFFTKKISPSAKVGIYWPMKYEIDTRPLIKILLEKKINLLLPTIVDNKMSFKSWNNNNNLKQNYYKFYEPHKNASSSKPDIIIVPLLASLILLDKSDETEKEAEKILNIATEKIEKLAKDFTE